MGIRVLPILMQRWRWRRCKNQSLWLKNQQASIHGLAEDDDVEEESVDNGEFAGLLWRRYSTASII
jgi:hypothetical protein